MTTLYDWFARTAAQHPDAVALELPERALTYRELSRCAAAVAARIEAAHRGRPTRVALLANRSLVAFAGYLATQRLGATVVPVNPGHPAARNRLILDAARYDVLLCDESASGELPDDALCLADDLPGTADGPHYQAGPDDVAYTLFTSGSTGRPKGVPIRHRNVSAYLAHNIARYRIGPGDRMSHTFDLTFDPSVFDLFVTWGAGATLVCPRRTDLLTPVSYVVDRELTHWFSVPSVVSVGADLGNLPVGLATGLRQSLFIGEQLSCARAHAWHEVAPNSLLDNVYGPTELTVACTEYRLPTDPDRWPVTSNDTVPIGPVYPFLDALLLDPEGRPADDGELVVRGSQRFDGYLDPADNRGRFVLDAEGGVGPDAYYRTGDRVRYEGGHLVHLGRLDHQVKVRGYRTELGEIETALARHPEVTEAVVVAVPDGSDTMLVACYCGREVPDGQLTRWLRARLPVHMVPRRFRHLDTMPLNPNGKTDRPALQQGVLADTPIAKG
jgi:amino acid adenylation domain-containing protein